MTPLVSPNSRLLIGFHECSLHFGFLNFYFLSFLAGFTMVDVMALGAMGHVLGVGIVLGLKGTGNL
jgi:hypothetical protein